MPECTRRRLAAPVDGDDLGFGHGLHRERHAFPPDSGVLAASERHRVDAEVTGVVDHHGADSQPLRDVERRVDVAGEDAGLKTVLGAVDRGHDGVDGVNGSMDTTGPNTSSVSTRAPAGTPVSTVGQ